MNEQFVFTKKQLLSIAKQLVSAMSELHRFNIIHRDIKPDNIIMNKSGHIWLIDYDIARIKRTELKKDTEQNGTFGYAPIEQYGIMPTDFKTDIYAFGATMLTLLKYSGFKGSLYRIAKKCTSLDPQKRYQSAQKLKRAIAFRFLKVPLLYIFPLILISAIIAGSLYNKNVSEKTFIGFKEYPKYTEFLKSGTLGNACIFNTDEPYEHLLFIDDVRLGGKIKLGKKDTLVNADIALKDGILSVKLKDKRGREFSNEFKNHYPFAKSYTMNLRTNADIICRDLDNDSIPELLIALSECSMNNSSNRINCLPNYCIGWCIKYSEDTGFTLCSGDMFTAGGSFCIMKGSSAVKADDYDFKTYRLDGNLLYDEFNQ